MFGLVSSLFAVGILLTRSCTWANSLTPSSPGNHPSTDPQGLTANKAGHGNFAKVPPKTYQTLQYGPGINAIHGKLDPMGYSFDDTRLMTHGLPTGEFRTLKTINCAHINPGNYFIGLTEEYALPDSSDLQVSSYHGWLPLIKFRISHNLYTLKAGESWTFVTWKSCGGKLVGIHFGTTDRVNGGTACGDYNLKGPPPRYVAKGTKCIGGTLWPLEGRKIVGLYGNANAMYLTRQQGVRGVGLITLPIDD